MLGGFVLLWRGLERGPSSVKSTQNVDNRQLHWAQLGDRG
jgi:hypothetical protein